MKLTRPKDLLMLLAWLFSKFRLAAVARGTPPATIWAPSSTTPPILRTSFSFVADLSLLAPRRHSSLRLALLELNGH